MGNSTWTPSSRSIQSGLVYGELAVPAEMGDRDRDVPVEGLDREHHGAVLPRPLEGGRGGDGGVGRIAHQRGVHLDPVELVLAAPVAGVGGYRAQVGRRGLRRT